jgi:anti-sigma B factor antagonist
VRSHQLSKGHQEDSVAYELVDVPASWEGLLLVARGELDIAAVSELRERLERATSSGAGRILLDLAEVTFIDSLSLAAIVAANRRLGHAGRLALVADHAYVLLILEACGLDSVVEVFRTRDEAETYLLA